jgi:L-alanine-DL-glutamate epimerase-like enolase superfamily enzyme
VQLAGIHGWSFTNEQVSDTHAFVEVKIAAHQLHPRGAFRIARTRTVPFDNVILRVEHDGVTGWGEASPHPYYGASAPRVVRNLERSSGWLRTLSIRSVADIAAAWKESWTQLAPDRAAQCALDLALWDWLARKEGVTVTELAHGHAPKPVTSFATIGLSTNEEVDEKIAELEGFPRVKLKSDASADLEPARRVKEALRCTIAIDANGAWSTKTLPALSLGFASLGAEFIEQPVPPAHDRELTRGSYPLPIIADESCVLEEDVDRLSGNFDGINVKLVKCGGLTPALRMVERASTLGMRTMVGCMLETSILIAAGCVAAQHADFADLDGAWLLADDPCTGWRFERGILHPPRALGLGAEPRDRVTRPPA